MLSRKKWTRPQIGLVIIYAIVITTIIISLAAGSHAAVFSFQGSSTDLFRIEPLQLFSTGGNGLRPGDQQTLWAPTASEPASGEYSFLYAQPAPAFGYAYTIAGNTSGFDATVDNLGNLYSAYESGGSIYIKKNIEDPELVSAGSGPVIAVDSSNNIHVIYSNSGLKYKKKTGNVWGSERAVPGGTAFYSLDTDSTGNAHIASDDGGISGRGHIAYVKDNGGTWSDPIFDWWGWYDGGCRCGNYYHLPVIRIDSGDKYHLAYELDNWGGQASWSERAINIASNSANGDKGASGFSWNAGVGLTRNSLTLNGSDAYIAYTSGGIQNIALVNASWTVLSSFAGSAGSAYYRNGVVGVSYVGGNVQYIEDSGAGFSDPADLGAGSSPVVLLGSRYVYFQNGSDIKLASSRVFAAPKAITGFELNALSPPVVGVVNEDAKTVALTVPYGTNVTALVPTITHTGASVSPASGVANNFTTPQTYTVTATDASTQAYVVTVTVAANPAKAITAFDLNGLNPAVIGIINEGAKTVALTVPFRTNVTALVPTITHTGASVNPASGAANDFTTPQTYTVTAADASTQAYVVTVTVAAPICAPKPSGMVSWWPGDGHARDIRGTNHGSLQNSPGFLPGKVESTFNFNGVNQYLYLPQTANLPVRGTNNFTIEAWVNHQGNEGNEMFNVFAYRNGGQDIQFFITRTQIGIWGTSSAGMVILTNHGVNAATWNHYAFTRSGNTWRVYVNGTQVGGDVTSTVSLLTPTTPQNIGTTGLANTQFAKGMIDEIGIYDRSLDQTEIQSIYNAQTAGKCRTATPAPVGLVSWWSGQGNAIDPRSRNDGILQNDAGFAAGMSGQGFSLYSINDYLEIPHSDSLNLAGGLTLETWFMQRTAGYGVLFSKSDYNGTQSETSYGLQVQPDGSINCALYGSYPADNWSTWAGLVVPGQWYHVAMTWDGSYSTVNNVKIYLNGDLVQSWTKSPTSLNTTPQSITIGSMKPPTYYGNIDGLIDEAAIFNRALSESEIQSIVNAGNAGKIKPTAVNSPAGLISWWAGDGDGRTLSGTGSNALLYNGTDFRLGKVGQAFNFDGINDYAEVAGSVYDPGSAEFSVDFWMNSRNTGAGAYLIGKSLPQLGQGWDIRLNNNRIEVVGVNGWATNLVSDASIQPNTWHHIALTSTLTTVTLYIDGVLNGTCPRSPVGATANPLRFGYTTDYGGTVFNGLMDEISFYTRAITAAEIASIYNAGLAGKLKQEATLVPGPVGGEMIRTSVGTSTTVGDVTVNFPSVTISGVTQQIPLDVTKLPALPMGAAATGLTYDIATSATWSGTPSVCFNVPALSSVYRNLRILHLENGVWVNRTQVPGSTPILCSYGLTSLSPFAIVDFGPTAASVSVSGRVMTAYGNGVRNAIVQLTDQDGVIRTARTGSFGYYRFEDVRVGETYMIGVASKRFVFTPRTIAVSDDVTDLDLVAQDQ